MTGEQPRHGAGSVASEQSGSEQSRSEQSRSEQSRSEQSRSESPNGEQARTDEHPPTGQRLIRFGRRAPSPKTARIEVGPEPRVSLLPPEVLVSRRGRRFRSRLLVVGLIVAVLMGATHFAAAERAGRAEQALADAEALTTQLLAEQAQFADLRRVTGAIEDTEAARDFGASTEIDWPGWLRDLRSALPASTVIDTVTVDAVSPLAPYSQSLLPLQPARVATVTLSLRSATIFDVSDLLTAMQSLEGFADAQPGLVSSTGTGEFQVDLTIHVDAEAFRNGSATGAGG